MGALDEIELLTFTVAFAPVSVVTPAIRSQLDKWWESGLVETTSSIPNAPFKLKKTAYHAHKVVVIHRIEPADLTLITTNLNDNYHSLSRMTSMNLPDIDFMEVHSEQQMQSFYVYRNYDQARFRLVRSMWDEPWNFFEKGPVEPFEEPDQYKKRRIRDRVTRPLIARYAARLGVDLEKIAAGDGVAPIVMFQQPEQANAATSQED